MREVGSVGERGAAAEGIVWSRETRRAGKLLSLKVRARPETEERMADIFITIVYGCAGLLVKKCGLIGGK